MRTARQIVASLWTLIVVLVLVIAPARAQPSNAEAESHFKRGVSLYQEADFKAATVEFRRAYDISKNWRLLFNVAQAENQAHDYAAALSDFETYSREGGDKIPRARKIEVDGEISKLRARVGKITVRSSIEGVVVTIDDEPVGAAPVTRNVGVGERRVVVKKDGYVTFSRTISVASGDGVNVDVVLEPIAGGASPPPPPPRPLPVEPARFPWEPWAVTGAFTIAAVTTGILALGAASDLHTAKNRFDVTDSELHDASKKVKTLGLVTDVISTVAIASAAVSVYFTLTSPWWQESRRPSVVGFSPQLSPTLAGLSASGRF